MPTPLIRSRLCIPEPVAITVAVLSRRTWRLAYCSSYPSVETAKASELRIRIDDIATLRVDFRREKAAEEQAKRKATTNHGSANTQSARRSPTNGSNMKPEINGPTTQPAMFTA